MLLSYKQNLMDKNDTACCQNINYWLKSNTDFLFLEMYLLIIPKNKLTIIAFRCASSLS